MTVVDNSAARVTASKAAVPTTPYTVISDSFDFENEDQELWWKDTAPLLLDLMVKAQYALPALGPFPRPGFQQIETAVPSGRLFELSVNFQQAASTIRYDFEPTSYLAGTCRDPYNQIMVNQLLANLQMAGKNVNTRLHYHFQNALSLSKEDIANLQKIESDLYTTQHIVAWDLKGNDDPLKMYLFPLAKSQAVGVPAGRLVMDAVGESDTNIQISPGFAMLNEYLREKELLENVYILAWDCVDHLPRIKVYIADPEVTVAKFKDLWTLGGRLKSPTVLKGLELVLDLWSCLGIPEGVRSTTELGQPEQEDGRSGLTFVFELKAGSLEPEPKMYFPLVGENDLQVANGLATFFNRLGWTEMASTYVTDLKDTL
ncbi:unnamed protein product [Penicillium discolor]